VSRSTGRTPGRPGIVVDARLLHYNRTGIGRYLRHLYRAIGDLEGADGLPPSLAHPRAQITVLYSRRDTLRPLQEPLPRSAIAWTPGHHSRERWALALEGARLRPRLWHAPDHVCPQPLGWRTVLTVHDLAFWRLPETHSPASRAYYAGLRRSAHQASRIICVSQATRRDLLEATGVADDKVRVVPEAPDPRFLLPPPPAEAPPGTGGAGRPYLLCVGTIEPRKNLPAVFRALARLPQRERPELRVVGAPGLDATAIQALPARLGLNGDVRFLGPRPTDELVALYAGALALVYPSLLEGFGLPVLEAMGAGAPVIASNRSSVPEVAGDAAILVDPEDDRSIAAALQRVTTSPALRDDLRARGRARVTQFSWDKAARRTLDVFAEALQS
jgi:glycosyltransferase involved in cell wall biosynthesis